MILEVVLFGKIEGKELDSYWGNWEEKCVEVRGNKEWEIEGKREREFSGEV